MLPLLRAAESGIQLTEALVETFDSNQRDWPYIYEGGSWSASIAQGALVWENRDPNTSHTTSRQLPLSSRRNYEIALEARLVSAGEKSALYGIQWGGATDFSAHHTFLVSPAGYRLQTYRNGETVVHASGALEGIYRARGNNLLSLQKLGAETAFLVNGVCIHIGPTLEPLGPMCGPYIDSGVAASFDSLRIHYLRGEPTAFAARLAEFAAAVGDASKSFIEIPPLSPEELAQAIVLAPNPVPPEVIDGLIAEAQALADADKPGQAASKLREALASNPERADAHTLYGWCALLLGDVATARRHADFAKLFDPLAFYARSLDAYAAAAEGKPSEAAQALRLSLFLNGADDVLGEYEKDFDKLAAAGIAPDSVAALRAELPALHRARSRAFRPFATALIQVEVAAAASDFASVAEAYARIRETMSSLPDEYAWLATALLARASSDLFYSDDSRAARPYLEASLASANARRDTTSPYTRALIIEQLAQLFSAVGEQANGLALAEAQLQATLALPQPAEYRKLELLSTLCGAANSLERADTLRGHANTLLGRARSLGSLWYEANALNYLGVSYWATRLPPDRQRMRELLEQAAQKAKEGGFDNLGESILANLAISYYQSGDKDKAKQTYQTLADQAVADARPLDAELHLNNYGAMCMMDRQYANAAEAFQRTVEIIEQHRDKVVDEERIRFLERRRGNFQFLAQCQALAGQSEALFRTQNAIRARVLAEELLVDAAPERLSLAAFQATLATDEAALFYTLNGACNVVIHVVTRESARPTYVELYEPFIELKRSYLDQLRGGRSGYKPVGYTAYADGTAYSDNNLATQVSREDFDQILEIGRGLIERSVKAPDDLRRQAVHEILVAFNELLISPISGSLAGKSKLLLFPDDVLYFLPFEALPMANGRYLAEDYEVRYAQSAEVREILRRRAYPEGRKPFLAMGGAIYEKMSEQAEPVSDETRHVQLKIQAAANAVADLPQREVYAALFSEAMNYLQGTLIEVLNLSQLFADPTIFIGEDMTENRLKAMSDSGELAQYEIVHLATHGFALPDFPQLSGLAMCIYSEMQGGEDGYLTAPEIARLKMQADLAVLSACQTGLGRIYGGEGVAGLTSSFLVGGANSALVTLWPVSDEGTMRYMTGLYQLVAQEGLSIADASTRMKRRFIAGEFGEAFRDIEIWAPFVLYGP